LCEVRRKDKKENNGDAATHCILGLFCRFYFNYLLPVNGSFQAAAEGEKLEKKKANP